MALLDTENDDEEVLTLFVYKASGQTAHTAESDPGFYSIKWLEVFLLSPGWDASPLRGYLQHTQKILVGC